MRSYCRTIGDAVQPPCGLRRLARDCAGSPAIEFAMIGPAFIALVIATLHTTLIFFAQEGLQTAAEASARLVMTGQAQNAGMTQSQFKTAACGTLPPFLTCDRLYVDVTTATSFSNASLAAPALTYAANGTVNTAFNYSPGTQGAIVVVRLAYLWPTTTGPLGFSLVNQQGSNRLILATSVAKTEGY